MSEFSGFDILSIVLVSVAMFMLVMDFYSLYTHGKIIIKIEKSKALAIFWVVLLVIWIMFLWQKLRIHNNYERYNYNNNNILLDIFWIEFSISNLVKSLRGSEIRENGMYKSGLFYRWCKIQSYSWVSPDTIKVRVKRLYKIKTSFELTIDEKYKSKVDEVIQRNLL